MWQAKGDRQLIDSELAWTIVCLLMFRLAPWMPCIALVNDGANSGLPHTSQVNGYAVYIIIYIIMVRTAALWVCDVSNKYAACNFCTLRICGGKCRVQLQAHSLASLEASEIDRKPVKSAQFQVKGTMEVQLLSYGNAFGLIATQSSSSSSSW